jgi:hypothetical protein
LWRLHVCRQLAGAASHFSAAVARTMHDPLKGAHPVSRTAVRRAAKLLDRMTTDGGSFAFANTRSQI